MSTDRPVAWLEVLRTLALRAIPSKRPRTRPYWALNAALTLVARGVGPILSRWMRYGPFSPRTSRPKDGSADSGVRSVSRLFLDSRLRKNQIKNAIKLMSATPPITPPATAIVDPFPLLPFFPLDPDADVEEEVVPTPRPFVACAVAPTVEDAWEKAVVEPRTSLWAAWEVIVVAAAADAVVNGAVDNAAGVVSVTLACGGMATAADSGSCGVEDADEDDSEENEEEAIIENWPIEAEVVAATGGGIVCSIEFCTAGAGGATWAIEVVEVNRDVENVLVVLVCVLMSGLGNAVHLLPCNVVIKAPRGKFGLVAMMMTVTKTTKICGISSLPCEGDSSRCFQNLGRSSNGFAGSLKLLVSNKSESMRPSSSVSCQREIKRCHLSKGRKRTTEHQGLTGHQSLAKFIQVERSLNNIGWGVFNLALSGYGGGGGEIDHQLGKACGDDLLLLLLLLLLAVLSSRREREKQGHVGGAWPRELFCCKGKGEGERVLQLGMVTRQRGVLEV